MISTSLYFVVFGAAIGGRIPDGGRGQLRFIHRAEGLIMLLSLLTQSIANASFGIYLPRFMSTIYEGYLSVMPVSTVEIVIGKLCRRGRVQIDHSRQHHPSDRWPVRCRCISPTSVLDDRLPGADGDDLRACSDLSLVYGLTDSRNLQIVPLLVITPLTFLGHGSFYLDPYAAAILAEKVTLANPVVYLVSGFRWRLLRDRRCQHRLPVSR